MLSGSVDSGKRLVFIIMASVLSGSLWARTVPVSYSRAVQLALANNPEIHAANASVDAAAGASKQADSMSWPRLELEVNGARTDNPMSVFGYKLSQGNASFADFGANQYTGPDSLYIRPQALNHPGFYSNLNTAFKLSVPLYSGGGIKARQAQMHALLAAAHRGDQQAKNQLAYEVYESYERFLTAAQLVDVAQKQADRARNFLAATKALNRQSLALSSDVLMAEAFLNSSLIGLSNAKIQTEDELDGFRTLLGRPESAVVPAGHTRLAGTNRLDSSLMAQVINNNPSMKTLRARLQAEKAAVVASQALYKPQVSMQLRHDWNGNTIGSGLPSDTIALGANWTIFSAGERAGAVQTASSNSKKIQFQLDEQRNQLILRLKKIQRAERQTQYELKLSRQTAEKEEEVIQKLRQRFGRGLVPLGALLESQIKLTQSRAQELQARHQSGVYRAQWLMLSNQLIPKAMKNA